jgi:hypothetical protein
MNTAADSPFRRNPVFWLMWLLPGSAVVAGLTTLGIALRHGDPPLPPDYHWEGEHLDQDFALARRAAALGVQVYFGADSRLGECLATLRSAPGDPASLTIMFTNGADPGRDRVVYLGRVAPGEYRGKCAAIPDGRWRIAVQDSSGQWAIRTQAAGSVASLTLRARDPGGS